MLGRLTGQRRAIFQTGPWPLAETPAITLTVRSTAWRCIVENFDAETQVLIFTWGTGVQDTRSHWVVNSYMKTDIPVGVLKSSFVTRIGKLKVIIPQKQRLADLGDRELRGVGETLQIV